MMLHTYSERKNPGPISAVPADPLLSVLLLCDDHPGHANTVLDHIAALRRFSAHDVRLYNPRGIPNSRWLDLAEFDVVVLHYSLLIISDDYVAAAFREKIRRFHGLKILFIQDEYRWVDESTAMMRDLGIHLLFSLLQPPEIHAVYDEDRAPGVIKLTTLAGYVPESLVGLDTPPPEARPLDIGYRGRLCPFQLGRLAQEKVWIAQGVLARAGRYGLRCDIGWTEETRIYGPRWNRFLASCKATLGTESGASITDFDGSLEKRTKGYLREHPDADFAEVYREILAPYEGNVPVTAVSPRIFEAAALRTAMILFPGDYSGVVQPWVHYIPLAKDFSNMDEVVENLRDVPFLRAMTERAYHDLVATGRYSQRSFARAFDEALARYAVPCGAGRKVRYHLARVERAADVAVMSARQFAQQKLLWMLPGLLKAAVALACLLRTWAGREILLSFLKDREIRKTVRFNQVLKDVLKLAIVGQARASQRGFDVAIRFAPEHGRLLFVSRPLDEPRSGGESCWEALAATVRQRRLQSMVWNHSAVGGNVRYALTPSWGLPVWVGDYGLHSFEGLLELTRRVPEPAWAVLSAWLGPRK